MGNSGYGIRAFDGDLTINGGQITATASDEQCGDAISAVDLTINDGQITATTSGYGACGLKAYNDVTIMGGVITATATGDSGSYGIQAERVIINSGQVTAWGSYKGIGSTYYDEGGISLSWKNTTDFIDANS